MRRPESNSNRLCFKIGLIRGAEEKLNAVNKELSVPIHPFDNFSVLISKLVSEIPNSTFGKKLPDQYYDFEDFDIVFGDIIGLNKLDVLFENPNVVLTDMRTVLEDLVPTEFISKLQDDYPLNVPSILGAMPEDIRASFAALATLIKSNNKNNYFVEWLGHALVKHTWHNFSSTRNSTIQKIGLFQKYRAAVASNVVYWAFLMNNKELILINAETGEIDIQFFVDHIDKSHSGNSIRIWREPDVLGIRLVILDKATGDNWADPQPLFPLMLPYCTNYVPPQLIAAFKESLLSQDTLVLRAMLHHEVIRMSFAQEAVNDLFTVFSHAGLVHRFISSVVTSEFTLSQLTENTVLRSNSHLTFLFKIFYAKFGKDFFYEVLKPIIEKVAQTGDIGLKDPKPENFPAVSELLNWVLDKYLSGGKFISPQFRHMASVLKSVTATNLRTRHSVFNALSSFMCLRFSNAVIADPTGYDASMPRPANMATTTIPFVQLLQLPFNLQPMSERYEPLKGLNEQIIDRYEEIYNFVMNVAEYKEPAEYPVPTEEQANAALLNLLKNLEKGRGYFMTRVQDIYDNESEKSSVSFMMSDLLTRLFK